MNAEFEDMTGKPCGIQSLMNVPVGRLGGIIVYFVHYKSFEDGVKAWRKRVPRINWDNIYVVLVERDGCTPQDIADFDKLPYKNKVALVHKEYDGIKSAYVVKGYEKETEVGNITIYTHKGYHREYDKFPWIKFLNKR